MSKDPAFLFYSSDFLTGVLTLSFEDRGKYITLLSLMHQQGRMDEKTISFIVGSFSDKLKNKFKQDENGLFYNERLEYEAEKRRKFTESRRNNGLLGGRGNKKNKTYHKAKQKHMDNHMENENVNVIDNDNKDTNPNPNPNVTIPISSNIVKIDKNNITELHKPIIDIYFQWHKKQFDIEPQFEKSDGIAVNTLIKYLQKNIKNKEGGAEEILQAWSLILEHYEQWDDFRKKLTRFRQIVPNLSQIIIDIKKKTGTGKSVTDTILDNVRKHFEEEEKLKGAKK